MTAHEMRTSNDLVDAIVTGGKTLTVRLADEWAHVCGLDDLEFRDEDGALVAHASVTRARTLPVETAFAVVNAHSGHQSYESLDVFLTALRGYYPDATITPDTDVRLFSFDVDSSAE